MLRLNKFIATCGVCSRRKADELISSGMVKVNGDVVSSLGMHIDPKIDEVFINNKKIKLNDEKVYIMLNKPKGYVTTNSDQFNRPSTIDIVKEDIRVFPVGRLDMYTEGLIILTNDGDFANKLTHPSHEIPKKYIVRVPNFVSDEKLLKLQNGVDIGGYITKKAKVKRASSRNIEVIISEGKNRQVRRMFEAIDIQVLNLKRVQIGDLNLGDLKVGEYKYLDSKDIKKLLD